MDCGGWALIYDPGQKRLMLLVELGGSTWRSNIYQTVRSLFVEADHPVPQRLAVHTTSFRGLFPRCSVEDRSDRPEADVPAPRPSSVWPNGELRRPNSLFSLQSLDPCRTVLRLPGVLITRASRKSSVTQSADWYNPLLAPDHAVPMNLFDAYIMSY